MQDFTFLILCLVLIKKIRRYGESKIPVSNNSDGKLPLKPSRSDNKSLGRVIFRIMSNVLLKHSTVVRR